jgi:RNA polymerase sigma-70 factor (sigma-E family)
VGTREFDEFAAARWPSLVRAGWLLTGDWQRAEDAAQATLERAWRHWSRVTAADDADRYVRRILVNETRRGWHAWRRLVPVGEVPDRAAEAPDVTGTRDALARALATLTRGQRACVVLRHYLDLSEAETAAALGCSVGTVKSQTSRALARLRESYALAEEP